MKTKNEWVEKHPKTTGVLTILFCLLLVYIFTGNSDTKEVATTKESATSTQALTLDDKLKALSIKSGSTDISYIKVEDQKADSDRAKDSRMITASYKVNSFYNKDSFMKESGNLTAKAFKEIYSANPNNYDAIVWYYGEAKDKYGNATTSIIMSQAIDKVTYQKINWDNFDSGKLCEFLRSESSINGGETACAIMVNLQ